MQIKYVGSVLPPEWIPAQTGAENARLKYAISVIGKDDGEVRPATVHARAGALVLAHYDTTGYENDEWLPEDSPRIHWTAAGGKPVFSAAGPPR